MFPAHPIPEDKILLGRICKAHGTKGEVVLSCFSEQPENIRQYGELFLMDADGRLSVPLTVGSCRKRGKNAILAFQGIRSRSQLEELLGAAVLVAKENLLPLPKNQFYWFQFQGKKVLTAAGEEIGTVQRLFSNGAQDILVVQAEGEAEEIFIPVTEEILIAEKKEQLIVAPPPGLLEINRRDRNK